MRKLLIALALLMSLTGCVRIFSEEQLTAAVADCKAQGGQETLRTINRNPAQVVRVDCRIGDRSRHYLPTKED